MASTSVGSIHYDLGLDTSKYDAAAGRVKDKTSALAGGFDTLRTIGTGAVIAVGAAIGVALVANLDRAVQRIDTLNNFPKVMSNLGYATAESSIAIKKLEAGVKGLPTSLSDIASAMQNIAPSSKSLDEATKLTLALNNALIAGGKPAAVQASAMEQFSQAISKGKPDMMEWRTLATAIPGQLDQIGQSLGYGRGEWQKMASDVTAGILPFDRVKGAIVSLNDKGLGQFPSFAEQAKNSSGGLATSIANMNTSIARGIAGVINAIGSTAVANAITSFGDNMEKALKRVSAAIVALSDFLNNNKGAMIVFQGAALGLAMALAFALAPAIWGVVTAIGAAMLAAAPFVLVGIALAGIAYLIKQNWATVSPVIDTLKNTFNTFWLFIQPFRDWVANTLVSAWDSLKRSFEQVRQALAPFMPQLQVLGAIIAVSILAPIAAAIAVFAAVVAAVIAVITIFAWLIAKITEVGAWLMGLGSRALIAMSQFTGAISQKVNEAVSWFAGLPGRIMGALGNLGGLLVNAGGDMISGLVRGISNGTNSVVQKIKDICSQSLNAVKSFFGIKSPSRIMAKQGNFIMQGMGVGLQKGTSAVIRTANQSMQLISDQMNGSAQIGAILGSSQSSSVAAMASANLGGGQAGGSTTVNIGAINNSQDEAYVLRRMDRNSRLESMGGAAV